MILVDAPVELSYLDAVILGIVEGLRVPAGLLDGPLRRLEASRICQRTGGHGITALIHTARSCARHLLRRRSCALFLECVAGLRHRAGPPNTIQLDGPIVGSLPSSSRELSMTISDRAQPLGRRRCAGPLGAVSGRDGSTTVSRARAAALRGRATIKDGLVIGSCSVSLALLCAIVATIAAGLMRGIDRVTSTELSFFLAIPALTGAGIYETFDTVDALKALGVGPILTGMVGAFVVAYASIAWLLRFVQSNSLISFIAYRVVLGAVLFVGRGGSAPPVGSEPLDPLEGRP